MRKETVAAGAWGLLIGLGAAWVWRDPSPNSVIGIQLLSAAVGFGAGLVADQFRIKIWARQETWKVKRELYSGVIRSLLEMQSALREIMSPFIPNAQRLDTVRSHFDKAHNSLLAAMADAAIVDDQVFRAITKAKTELEALIPREHAVAWTKRQFEIDSAQVVIDDRRNSIQKRIDPLLAKLHRAIDFGEEMTEHESRSLERLFLEQGTVLADWKALTEQRESFNAYTAEDQQALQKAYTELAETLLQAVIAAAREGGLEP